jgi:hypothetical protein
MRINIWIPDETLKLIDESCRQKGLSRSEYLVGCAIPTVAYTEKKEVPFGANVKLHQIENVCKHGSMKGVCKYGCK